MDIKDFLIDEECTMLECMALLDKAAKKVMFVLHEGRFVAAVTDGDIRRWILKKGSLDAKIKDIANYNPRYLHVKEKTFAKEYLKKWSLEALPILDSNEKIVSIVFRHAGEVKRCSEMTLPVVIMAGGLGTRLYPYTKILPKPLIPIGEIPIVEHIINRFNNCGISTFYMIVNHKKNMIKAYFNEIEKEYRIHYIDEDRPLGTGGGLSLLKGKINTTFILSNCDILIEDDYEKIVSHHQKEGNLITMVCSLKKTVIPYGVIEINETGEIEKMTEKPEFSYFINTGMYVVEPKVIEEMERDTPISFPEIIEQYKDAGEKIGVYPISENSWLDMGQLDELEEMRKRLEADDE